MTSSRGDADPLPERIRRRILDQGPLTFAAFMEEALYDPHGGFYATPPVGPSEDTHFATSPHVSPAFGMLLAAQLGDMWELLGRPDPFAVVEVGAGDGTLARQLMEFLPPPVSRATAYVAVDRSPGARRSLDELAATSEGALVALSALDEVRGGLHGCILANELLDNLPFHLLRGTPGGPAEVHVAVLEGRFILEEGPPSDPVLVEAAADLQPGQQAVVQVEAERFLEQAAALLDRGYLWVADYGFTGGDRAAAPHAYRSHRLEPDVLEDPGSRDITAGVDFDRMADVARAAGHEVWGPISQRDALIALGFRTLDDGARARQVEAMSAGRGIEAARIYAARSRATPLVDPAGPGGFLVLCVGVGGAPQPDAVRTASGR